MHLDVFFILATLEDVLALSFSQITPFFPPFDMLLKVDFIKTRLLLDFYRN
jgi:hypothetical protein